MRQIAALLAPREPLDELWQILPRLDCANVKDEPFRQAVAPPHALKDRRVFNGRKRRGGRLVNDVHSFGLRTVQPHDVALRALRHGDDGVSAPGRQIDERSIQQHSSWRMIPREHRQTHVVNRDDGGDRRCERHHPVREVHQIGAQLAKQARRERLHPDHPRHARRRDDDANLRRQRPDGVERTVGQDDDLVVHALFREVMQQVLGVVAHSGPSGPQCCAIKGDAHGVQSSRPARRSIQG